MATKKTPARKTPARNAPPAHAAPAGAEPTEEQLQAAYEKAVRAYAHRSNVTGVDIGFRYKDGKRLESSGVRIHVAEKLPPSQLEAEDVLPASIDGVPVDVIQAVYKPHGDMLAALEPEALSRKARADTLQPGLSVSHPNVTSGTLGAVVYDRTTGQRAILSNWHVLVGSLSAQAGDAVIQPGRKWGGRAPRDRIGSLERFLLDSHGDAAIALLNGSREVDPAQLESGAVVKHARRVRRGEIVEKSGATTGVTRGRVDGEGQYTLSYSVGTKTIRGFKVVAEDDGNPHGLEVSAGGDSGSLWYAVDDKAGVGLHFAGEVDPNPTEEHAIACHLPTVLAQLNISLEPVTVVLPAPIEEGAAAPWPLALPPSMAGTDAQQLVLETVARLSRLLEAALLPDKK